MISIGEALVLLSISLTVPTVIGCGAVVMLWRRAAWKAWQVEHKSELHYFMIGVLIAFVGSTLVHSYWSMAFVARYMEWGIHAALSRNGVYVMIVSQVMTAGAAAYHVRAAAITSSHVFRRWVVGAWVGGLATALLLFAIHLVYIGAYRGVEGAL